MAISRSEKGKYEDWKQGNMRAWAVPPLRRT